MKRVETAPASERNWQRTAIIAFAIVEAIGIAYLIFYLVNQ